MTLSLLVACASSAGSRDLWSAKSIVFSDNKQGTASEHVTLEMKNHRAVGSVNRLLIQKLIDINQKISQLAGVTTQIYLTNRGEPQANAYAAHIHNQHIIAINFKMLAMLGSDEGMYAALIAHEISHIVHQDKVNVLLNKKQEEQADKLGVRLMLEAGYSAESALSFYTLLATTPANKQPFFSSHPSSKKRLQYVRESILKFKQK